MARQGAKEQIEQLEEKVDILYNAVWQLAVATEQHELAEHILGDVMYHVNAKELSNEEFDEIGRC